MQTGRSIPARRLLVMRVLSGRWRTSDQPLLASAEIIRSWCGCGKRLSPGPSIGCAGRPRPRSPVPRSRSATASVACSPPPAPSPRSYRKNPLSDGALRRAVALSCCGISPQGIGADTRNTRQLLKDVRKYKVNGRSPTASRSP